MKKHSKIQRRTKVKGKDEYSMRQIIDKILCRHFKHNHYFISNQAKINTTKINDAIMSNVMNVIHKILNCHLNHE